MSVLDDRLNQILPLTSASFLSSDGIATSTVHFRYQPKKNYGFADTFVS